MLIEVEHQRAFHRRGHGVSVARRCRSKHRVLQQSKHWCWFEHSVQVEEGSHD